MNIFTKIIAKQLSLPQDGVENTLKLLDEGCTIPFISRYRKERTGGLNEVQIAQISDLNEKLKEMAKRKETILKTITELGKLTPELQKRIDECWNATELEDIYLPYRPKRRTRAQVAREQGLEPLAQMLLSYAAPNPQKAAMSFVKDDVKDVEMALQGAKDIIAEQLAEDEKCRNIVRQQFRRDAFIISKVVKAKKDTDEAQKFSDYFEWEEPLRRCSSHRLLAMRRGENEGILRVKIETDDDECISRLRRCLPPIPPQGGGACKRLLYEALEDGYKRLLQPSIETEFANLSKEKADLEEKIADITSRLEDGRSRSDALMASQKKAREELESVRDERYKLEVRTARNETLLDTQKDKLWDEFEVSYAEALDMRDENFAITAGNRESREIRLRLAELGDVNVGAIEEYKTVSKRYEFMTAQEADLTKAMNELNEIISNMDKTIRHKFKENFDRVVVNFEQSFKELFGGGYAELRLEDETKPLESGIEITAQPPGKKLKNINLLSGGEKTLTAIALMFAVLKAKPTPFVILDEVEAALDEVNIERFSDYLKNFENIQFALITHQKATMEHADVLYGVTMPEQGISRMLSLKLGDEFDPEGLE